MKPFPDPHELIWLFEVEPDILGSQVPWIYNQLTFLTSRGRDQLAVVIAPAYGEISVRWTRDGSELVALDAQGVEGIRIDRERGAEALLATFREASILPLRVQLKPVVHVSWGTSAYPSV